MSGPLAFLHRTGGTVNARPRDVSPAEESRTNPQTGLRGSGLPRQRRIRKRPEFNTVFDRGQRIHGRFFTLLLLPTTSACSRLGMVASRKIGGAVQRNRAKRLIREMFRTEVRLAAAPAVDLVVIPRRELVEAEFATAAQDFRHTLRRGLDRLASTRRG
jgi:ribonuclease P protein component